MGVFIVFCDVDGFFRLLLRCIRCIFGNGNEGEGRIGGKIGVMILFGSLLLCDINVWKNVFYYWFEGRSRGGEFFYNKLMGMYYWMGLYCYGWIDYNVVVCFKELLGWSIIFFILRRFW